MIEPLELEIGPRLQAVQLLPGPPGEPVALWASGIDNLWLRRVEDQVRVRDKKVADTFFGSEPALQFRDLHAIDPERAWLLASGEGALSAIYFTADGGASWDLQFQNQEPAAFYDCFAFWNERTGFVFSDSIPDPVDDQSARMLLRRTVDGEEWSEVPGASLPAAQPGEGGFAASGDCAAIIGDPSEGRGIVAMGNAPRVRVLLTSDFGGSWRAVETGLEGGSAIGLTAVAFRPPTPGKRSDFGVAVGGVIGNPDSEPFVVLTNDGGESWTPASSLPPIAGALYGVAMATADDATGDPLIVVTGPGGAALSGNRARTWELISAQDFWSVDLLPDGRGALVGPDQRISLVALRR